MTRREALDKRVTELRADLTHAWANCMPLRRMVLLREYLASAVQELRQIERAEKAAEP